MKNRIKDKSRKRMCNHRGNPKRYGRNSLSVLLFIMSLLSSVVWFSSCTDDNFPTDEWPGKNSPVELTARVGGPVQSRATVDNTWEGGEEVAVQLDGKHYKFIADVEGKLTAAPGQEVPRWNSPDEEKTVVAWYPYSDELPEAITVKKDQEYTPYEQNDFLFAPATRISLTGNRAITLRHLLTKVVINLKAGDGVTEDNIRPARLQFCNQSFTPNKINPDGTIEQKPAAIYPDSLYAHARLIPETGFVKTFEALLVPQILNKNEVFIKFRNTQLALIFTYTPQRDDELTLKGGHKYTYNITVEREGFSVVRFEESTAWEDTEDKELTARTPQPGFRATDTKIFDYFYSDGTRSDGGYRRYTDGTEAWLDIAPVEGKQVIGIVFQTDWKRMTKAETDKGWTHGYVVALTACGEFPEQSANKWYWGASGSIPGMTAITTFYDCKSFLSGYEATRQVIDAIGKGNPDALKDTKYEAFYQVSQYGKTDRTKPYAAPAGTSGWYLPSAGQWWDIAENLFGCKFNTTGNVSLDQEQPYARRNISTQLEWIPGAQDFSFRYWTSSIYDNNNAWFFNFDMRNNTIKLGKIIKNYTGLVRPVLAF